MPVADLFRRLPPDIRSLEVRRDIPALIRLLSSREPGVQIAAAGALGRIGPDAAGLLVPALRTKNRTLRLGVVCALTAIREPAALPALLEMTRDASSEVRWQACIALGEMGDAGSAPALRVLLRDRDKYVRYASALSLEKLGDCPETGEELAFQYAGMQEWEKLVGLASEALPAVINLLSDPDPEVRIKAIHALGAIGNRDAGPALLQALGDADRRVRWAATLAARKCGVSPMLLPRGLCRRPRQKKIPLIAGFLNFLLPGLGYGYLGKWWGIMIFQIDITVTVWLFKFSGEAATYCILFPFYILLGIHAWYIGKLMPEEPP